MKISNLKYQIFGSADSVDIDMMIFVDELQTIEGNHCLIKEYNEFFSSKYDKKINCNLAVLKDGMVVDVFKGTADECNNSLYYTYDNHLNIQDFPNQIEKLYDRSKRSIYFHIKLIRVARFILSFFSREPELREMIKPALKGDLLLRLKVLSKIDFTKYTTFPHKKEKHEDIYKVLAFQFAQCFGLRTNCEIYSKSDAKNMFSYFSDMLDRKEITLKDLHLLNNSLELFITMCEAEIESGRMTSFSE